MSSGASADDIFTGNIKIQSEEMPYSLFPYWCPVKEVLDVMVKDWKLDPPKIMLLIVSDQAPLKGWDSYKEQKNFVKGLIKGSNATSMWIFTTGLNIGISKIIGDAFQDDYNKRNSQICFRHAKVKKVVTKSPLIGLCRENMLTYHSEFETPEKVMNLENNGNSLEEQKFNLNPYHTHFLIIKEHAFSKDSSSRFLLRLIDTIQLTPESDAEEKTFPLSNVPIIAILIQGNSNSINYVLAHLKRNLPLLVIRGSGGLADVFAYAYYEVCRSVQKVKDTDYVETILRRGLNDKITSIFPNLKDNKMARNLLCGRVLECIECSEPPKMKHITVLNVLDLTCHMEDLPSYLLQVLFKSKKSETTSAHAELRKDLQLTIDWNCPEIALTKVFYKDSTFKVENIVFERVLLEKGREAFVSLFLDNGFAIHRYLSSAQLIKLYEHSMAENFFQEVCWKGILGYKEVTNLDNSFIDNDLNWIIESLLGIAIFINAEKLTKSSLEIFDTSEGKKANVDVAKRKALMTLIIWALLSKRSELAIVVWRHVDQPIMTALVASLLLDKMKMFIKEPEAVEEIADLSQKFATMAAGVFDLCYNDTPSKAYDSLNVRVDEWEGLALIDMASLSQNRIFVSHPCCQKWLTNKFMGNIKIRELPWGFVTFPVYIKVILCAFCVFPMYLWARFKEAHEFVETNDDETADADPYYVPDPKEKTRRTPLEEAGRSHLLKYQYPPLYKMIYWMWSAPITKFWVSNIFYMVYLLIFSLAVLWPSCGNVYMDLIVCLWTLTIAIDSMFRLYSIHEAYPNTPIFASCLEIIYILFFVLFHFLLRVVNFEGFRDPYGGKILVTGGMIYFYYRMIFIYLPISATLGPLLYRVKTMITVDFVNFMKLLVFILIANGITMQAILFPDYPLIPELIRKSFHKAFFTIFMVPIDEVVATGDGSCVRWEQKPKEETMCRVSDFVDEKCPSGQGFWPYVLVMYYLFLVKQVLMTVLFALFNNTGARSGAEMDSIWKFQRYNLIISFSNSLRLPPPLNIFSVLIILYRFAKTWCKHGVSYVKKKKIPKMMTDEKQETSLASVEYSYWKQLASDYFASKKYEKEENSYIKRELDMMSQLSDDLNMKEMLIYRAKAQIRQLESDICYTYAHLETLKYRAEKEETKRSISVHSLSRESPYPRTKFQRFPVPDKYVPWEVMWLHYEPVVYIMPKKYFSAMLQPYVDDDVLTKTEKGSKKPEMPVFKWNLESVGADGVYRNRKSWMTDHKNEPITYRLDFFNLPRNPMGRTGLRGKGALPRWGPNHNLFVIITRWKKKKSAQEDESLMETSDHLEYVETWFMKKKDISLPGGFVSSENRYEVIQSCFNTDDSEPWQSSEDMIKFFKDHVVASTDEEKDTEEEFISKQVYCGYMDDQLNTDQAWKEVELWHIHYNTVSNLHKSFKANIRWRLLSEDVFIQLPYGQTTLLQEAIRPLNAEIEAYI